MDHIQLNTFVQLVPVLVVTTNSVGNQDVLGISIIQQTSME